MKQSTDETKTTSIFGAVVGLRPEFLGSWINSLERKIKLDSSRKELKRGSIVVGGGGLPDVGGVGRPDVAERAERIVLQANLQQTTSRARQCHVTSVD